MGNQFENKAIKLHGLIGGDGKRRGAAAANLNCHF